MICLHCLVNDFIERIETMAGVSHSDLSSSLEMLEFSDLSFVGFLVFSCFYTSFNTAYASAYF